MTDSGYVYKTSAGESFDSVALVLFGDEKYASELLNANPLLCEKLVFDGTEKVIIPEVTVDDASEYMPADAPWKE